MRPRLLVVGEWPLPQGELEPIVRGAGYELSHAPVGGNPGYRRALVALLGQRPDLVLLAYSWYTGGTKGIGGLIETLRSQGALHDVPILAVVDEAHDAAILEAFQRGCDDVVPCDPVALREKLCALAASRQPPRVEPLGRSVLVVEGLKLHRTVFARLLEGAGYEVITAGAHEEACAALAARRFDLALLDLSLSTKGAPALAHLMSARGLRVIGVSAYHDEARPGTEEGVHLYFSKNAPPEDLLFLLNDLLSPSVVQRQAPRRLWSEVVRFGDQLGLGYNLSRSGLFVRTLTPPRAGEQLRLETPFRAVEQRLSGLARVIWQKPYVARGAQNYPPGFGATLEALSLEEAAAWELEWARQEQK